MAEWLCSGLQLRVDQFDSGPCLQSIENASNEGYYQVMSKAAAQSPKTELDFVQARKNMVDCQIHTSGVVHTGLLQAFETVPRELFVPEHLKGIAYFDEDIQLAKGRYLSEPLILSKMLQAADLQSDDVVLDIGGGTGYCAAILSSNVSTIIAVESDDAYIAAAKSNWSELDACNIVQVKACLLYTSDAADD